MVTARLSCQDAKEKGWLLYGYPRGFAQAQSLEEVNIRPDIYIVLDVPDEILIDRCVVEGPSDGENLSSENFPPDSDEIKARLVTLADDTEEKDLKAMPDAAGNWPDLPGSSGIMQTMGRDKRLKLLYYAGTQYPIMGAIRMTYPYGYELYKRVDEPSGKEKYVSLSTFTERPTIDEINDGFLGKPRNKDKKASGIW
ncbi:hypothetical protein CRYUN_Cryun33cG0032600 [Craigia yunnanensis]